MSFCPYCNAHLKPGQKFCKGHNIAYKRRLLYQYENGDTSAYAELSRWGWLPARSSRNHSASVSFEPVNFNFRKFGIELETVSGSEISVTDTINFSRTYGININTSSYGHELRNYWKVTTDGSLTGGFGREFVSPPFTDETIAEREIRNLTDAMNLLDVKVNNSCGFHIHFDISDMTPKQVARAIKFYQVYESEIDKLHQNSRRGNSPRYCGGLRNYSFNPDTITTFSQLENIFTTRYLKVNIQAYLRHGTLEFRQHGGTLSFVKIWNWMKFCERILEYGKTNNPISTSKPLFDALNLSEEERCYWNIRKKQLGGVV